MEGKAEAVLEQAADWREAVGAWGVLVDVELKRDDLPYVPVDIVKARLTKIGPHLLV
jgi:nuclear pore complex protein Nup85